MSLATSPARCRRYSRGPSEPFSPEFGLSRLGLTRARFASTFVVAPSSCVRPTRARELLSSSRLSSSGLSSSPRPTSPGKCVPGPGQASVVVLRCVGRVPCFVSPVPSGLLLRRPPGRRPPGCRPPDCRPPASARPVPGNAFPVQVRLLPSSSDATRRVPGIVSPVPSGHLLCRRRRRCHRRRRRPAVIRQPPDQFRAVRSRPRAVSFILVISGCSCS